MSARHTGIVEFNPAARSQLLMPKRTSLFRLTFTVLLGGVGLGLLGLTLAVLLGGGAGREHSLE